MKRVRIALAAFAGIAGIGGAYAVDGQNSNGNYRTGTIFNWYTVGGTLVAQVTVGRAGEIAYCPGGDAFCLRGTSSGKNTITLFKPSRSL